MDPAHDLQPEMDVQQQRHPVVDDEADPGVEVPLEADPGDVAEQAPPVGYDEDEYREEDSP
jgi:hypothetical protein